MMDGFWLYLRNTPVGRRIREYPELARPLHALGCRMLPEACEVRRGPCAGLVLEPSPKWPTDLWEGGYELEVQEALNALLGPGNVFYDVGGGIGIYTLLAARKGARVFVFEPLDENARSIARHARRNKMEKAVEIVPFAAHSATGRVKMQLAQNGSQLASAQDPRPEGTAKLFDVPCVKLDDFAESHPPPSVIKVDVEGGESEVLKGAERVFAQERPVLICEVHDRENERFTRQWLAANEYEVRWLEPPGRERHLFGKPRNARPSRSS